VDQERLSKLKKLPSLGVHPYPEKYLDTVSSTQAKVMAEKNKPRDTKEVMEDAQKSLRIAGRMMTFRSHGKLSFAQLQDFEGRIQIAFVKGVTEVVKNMKESEGDGSSEEMPAHKFWEKMLDLGDYIGLEGELFITNHGETTLMVKELTFLGKSLHPLPEKFHGLNDEETILRQRYLDTLTSEESRKRFKMRSDFIKELRKFMWENKFDEVETPTLEHGATGAAAKPYNTHNNALDIDLVLRISQELPLKKVIIGGFERVFEIGKAFRNEGIDPSHLPEHTHFEWYTAYWSFKENMNFSEKMIKHLIQSLGINPIVPIKDKDGNIQNVDFSSSWERIDYVDLIKKDSGIDIMEVRTTEGLRKAIKEKKIMIPDMENMLYPTLVDYLYKKVSRPKIIGPAFLYNYPKALQPLARTNDENPEMVDQFQLVVNGWEIVKGYSELVDPIDQAERFKEQEGALEVGDEEAMQGDDEYIRAMEQGMPPISGVGLGIDRFITLLTQQDNLRDCVLFPLMRPKGNSSTVLDCE
jgi:lysyl-tRNA synthetase, class II